MDRAAAFHEAKWRMYKRHQNYEKAKHHAARARYYRTAFGAGPAPWFAAKLTPTGPESTISEITSDDHRLCVMSFFEFYNLEKNAYIHMWEAHEEDKPLDKWPCPFHDQQLKPKPPLFDFAFTTTNVRNLVSSLSGTTQWINYAPSGAQSVQPSVHAAASVTNKEYFKFGLNDVLGWLLPPTHDCLFPHVIDICEYLNSLVVANCKKNDKGQWRLTVESTQNFAVDHLNKDPGIFCRPTPKPQRAMDVIPIILRTDNTRKITRIETTVGSRTRTVAGVRFGTETTSYIVALEIDKAGCSDGYQVGAGEHLEKGEYKSSTKDNKLSELSDGNQKPAPKLLASRKLGDKGPIFRALNEEVGLPEQVVRDGKVFLLGTHTTGVGAAVGRDARYWPRIHGNLHNSVVYGYPRETSTALSAIVLQYHVDDELKCKQQDTKEVKTSMPIEWKKLLAEFKGAGSTATKYKKPAFGYAHEMMVKWVDMCMVDMIRDYIGHTHLISPTDPYISTQGPEAESRRGVKRKPDDELVVN